MTTSAESRCLSYISKITATSGQSGHNATFSVACKIREFGLPFERAEIVFAQWNEARCHPKWPASALRHKLISAFRHTTPRPEYMTAGKCGSVTPRSQTLPSRPRPCVTDEAKAESAQLAATIKLMRYDPNEQSAPVSESEVTTVFTAARSALRDWQLSRNIGTVARLRGVTPMAVQCAYWRGLIGFGNHLRLPAWFVFDKSGRVASARRLDGHRWFEGTQDACKSVMLRASQAKWPIGIREAKDYQNIMLVEGAPDLIAAFEAIREHSDKIAPVAMLSASCPIHTDARRLFDDKRVRIFAHNDASGAGQRAAEGWSKQLTERGCTVDIFSFDRWGVNDLNEYVLGRFPYENLLPQ